MTDKTILVRRIYSLNKQIVDYLHIIYCLRNLLPYHERTKYDFNYQSGRHDNINDFENECNKLNNFIVEIIERLGKKADVEQSDIMSYFKNWGNIVKGKSSFTYYHDFLLSNEVITPHKYYDLKQYFNDNFGLPDDTPLSAGYDGYILYGVPITLEDFYLEQATFNVAEAITIKELLFKITYNKSFEDINGIRELSKTTIPLQSMIEIRSINGFLNLFSFIESFVSNAGLDYILRRYSQKTIPTFERYMRGKRKKNGQLTLTEKLAVYPLIINEKNESKPNISENKKNDNFLRTLKEQYENKNPLFMKYKEKRNTLLHNNPKTIESFELFKVPPMHWFNVAEGALKEITRVANEFWLNCGHTVTPKYIDLDAEGRLKMAKSVILDQISLLNNAFNNNGSK